MGNTTQSRAQKHVQSCNEELNYVDAHSSVAVVHVRSVRTDARDGAAQMLAPRVSKPSASPSPSLSAFLALCSHGPRPFLTLMRAEQRGALGASWLHSSAVAVYCNLRFDLARTRTR